MKQSLQPSLTHMFVQPSRYRVYWQRRALKTAAARREIARIRADLRWITAADLSV